MRSRRHQQQGRHHASVQIGHSALAAAALSVGAKVLTGCC
jgi:hypothetical protein